MHVSNPPASDTMICMKVMTLTLMNRNHKILDFMLNEETMDPIQITRTYELECAPYSLRKEASLSSLSDWLDDRYSFHASVSDGDRFDLLNF